MHLAITTICLAILTSVVFGDDNLHGLPKANSRPKGVPTAFLKKSPTDLKDFLKRLSVKSELDEESATELQQLDWKSYLLLREELSRPAPAGIDAKLWKRTVEMVNAEMEADELSLSARRLAELKVNRALNTPSLLREVSNRLAELESSLNAVHLFKEPEIKYLRALKAQLNEELKILRSKIARLPDPKSAADLAAILRQDPERFHSEAARPDNFKLMLAAAGKVQPSSEELAAFWAAYTHKHAQKQKVFEHQVAAPGLELLTSEVDFLLDLPFLNEGKTANRLNAMGPHLESFRKRLEKINDAPPGFSQARWSRLRGLMLKSAAAAVPAAVAQDPSVGCPPPKLRWAPAEVSLYVRTMRVCYPDAAAVKGLLGHLSYPALQELKRELGRDTIEALEEDPQFLARVVANGLKDASEKRLFTQPQVELLLGKGKAGELSLDPPLQTALAALKSTGASPAPVTAAKPAPKLEAVVVAAPAPRRVVPLPPTLPAPKYRLADLTHGNFDKYSDALRQQNGAPLTKEEISFIDHFDTLTDEQKDAWLSQLPMAAFETFSTNLHAEGAPADASPKFNANRKLVADHVQKVNENPARRRDFWLRSYADKEQAKLLDSKDIRRRQDELLGSYLSLEKEKARAAGEKLSDIEKAQDEIDEELALIGTVRRASIPIRPLTGTEYAEVLTASPKLFYEQVRVLKEDQREELASELATLLKLKDDRNLHLDHALSAVESTLPSGRRKSAFLSSAPLIKRRKEIEDVRFAATQAACQLFVERDNSGVARFNRAMEAFGSTQRERNALNEYRLDLILEDVGLPKFQYGSDPKNLESFAQYLMRMSPEHVDGVIANLKSNAHRTTNQPVYPEHLALAQRAARFHASAGIAPANLEGGADYLYFAGLRARHWEEKNICPPQARVREKLREARLQMLALAALPPEHAPLAGKIWSMSDEQLRAMAQRAFMAQLNPQAEKDKKPEDRTPPLTQLLPILEHYRRALYSKAGPPAGYQEDLERPLRILGEAIAKEYEAKFLEIRRLLTSNKLDELKRLREQLELSGNSADPTDPMAKLGLWGVLPTLIYGAGSKYCSMEVGIPVGKKLLEYEAEYNAMSTLLKRDRNQAFAYEAPDKKKLFILPEAKRASTDRTLEILPEEEFYNRVQKLGLEMEKAFVNYSKNASTSASVAHMDFAAVVNHFTQARKDSKGAFETGAQKDQHAVFQALMRSMERLSDMGMDPAEMSKLRVAVLEVAKNQDKDLEKVVDGAAKRMVFYAAEIGTFFLPIKGAPMMSATGLTARIVIPPALGALFGGGVDAAKQLAQIADGTIKAKDFSFDKVGESALTGAGIGLALGVAPLKIGVRAARMLAVQGLVDGVYNSAEHFGDKKFFEGTVDAATVALSAWGFRQTVPRIGTPKVPTVSVKPNGPPSGPSRGLASEEPTSVTTTPQLPSGDPHVATNAPGQPPGALPGSANWSPPRAPVEMLYRQRARVDGKPSKPEVVEHETSSAAAAGEWAAIPPAPKRMLTADEATALVKNGLLKKGTYEIDPVTKRTDLDWASLTPQEKGIVANAPKTTAELPQLPATAVTAKAGTQTATGTQFTPIAPLKQGQNPIFIPVVNDPNQHLNPQPGQLSAFDQLRRGLSQLIYVPAEVNPNAHLDPENKPSTTFDDLRRKLSELIFIPSGVDANAHLKAPDARKPFELFDRKLAPVHKDDKKATARVPWVIRLPKTGGGGGPRFVIPGKEELEEVPDTVPLSSRPSIDLKNSAVYSKLTDEEKKAQEKLNAEVKESEDRSKADSEAFARKATRLAELQAKSNKSDDEIAEQKALEKELEYDHIIVGKGHNSVIEVREILKNDPEARILIIGAEPNFWAELGFSIAVVGNIHGFMERNGGAALMATDFAKEYLKKHEGQMAGHFLGKWINDHVRHWQGLPPSNNKPTIPDHGKGKVTVLTGQYVGVAADKKTTVLKVAGQNIAVKGEAMLAPGLGKPTDLVVKMHDGTEKPSKQVVKGADGAVLKLNGYPVIFDNIESQQAFANAVLKGEPIMDMLKADQKSGEPVNYLIAGQGDGALSVMEGLLQGTFRECCSSAKYKTWDEQAKAFSEAMGNIKIYWAGKDSLKEGLTASLSIPRYAKIKQLLQMLEKHGKLIRDNDAKVEVKYTGDPKNPFAASAARAAGQGTSPINGVPIKRVFHNIGNTGPDPILQTLSQSLNGGAALRGPTLYRSLDFEPVYGKVYDAYRDEPVDTVIGLKVRNDKGETVATFTGTGGVVLSLKLFGAMKDANFGKQPDNFFLGNAEERERFMAVVGKHNERMLHLDSLRNRAVRLTQNNRAAEIIDDEYVNEAGVEASSLYAENIARYAALRVYAERELALRASNRVAPIPRAPVGQAPQPMRP